MKGSKEFFEELRESDEWASVLMTKEDYCSLSYELRQRTSTTIRQHSIKFKDDPVHQELVKAKSKANRALIDYEFKMNHG